MHDTWSVAGLQGTGSKDASTDDVFMPDYPTVAYADMLGATSPGLETNPQPLFNFPIRAAGGYVLVSTLQGAAFGALEGFSASAHPTAARSSGQGRQRRRVNGRDGVAIRRRSFGDLFITDNHVRARPVFHDHLLSDASLAIHRP
ncbi:MAG: hypothetical protein FJY55_15760 [Betaproteobacteria bacterium]|nr:hypothetical protein [Betaproteobacteria bacterium]